jgi:hypothetical protein
MGLRKYAVTIDGKTSDMLLSDEDAQRYGDAAVPAEGGATPAATGDDEATKQRTVQNKARTAAK